MLGTESVPMIRRSINRTGIRPGRVSPKRLDLLRLRSNPEADAHRIKSRGEGLPCVRKRRFVGIFVGCKKAPLRVPCKPLKGMAGTTGLEPAASAVTGQRSNQLNYVPTRQINEMHNRQCLCRVARFAYRAWNCTGCPKERDSCPNRPQTSASACSCALCKTTGTDPSARSRLLPTWARPPEKVGKSFSTEIS